MFFAMIDPEISEYFRGRLWRGEKIVWTGRPVGFVVDYPSFGKGLFALGAGLILHYYGGRFSVLSWLLLATAGGLFAKTFLWNFDRYAITNQRLLIRRIFVDGELSHKKIDNLSVKSRNIIITHEGVSIDESCKGSNSSSTVGLTTYHKFVLYRIQNVDWVANYIQGKQL